MFSSTPAREPVRFYFKQFLFTGVLLVLSSIIVHSGVVSQIQPMVEFVFPEGMLEWFIYPLLLVVFASIIPSEKAPEDTRIGTRARKK
ncbi:MAG TPA: hypothetical protein PKA63_00690 [Oligoflexia bacterium]|nr:hypothetical protein [Oligoflexia bacterium]HMP47167.1 hypothetical protein [Oligoflexia bacterium]